MKIQDITKRIIVFGNGICSIEVTIEKGKAEEGGIVARLTIDTSERSFDRFNTARLSLEQLLVVKDVIDEALTESYKTKEGKE